MKPKQGSIKFFRVLLGVLLLLCIAMSPVDLYSQTDSAATEEAIPEFTPNAPVEDFNDEEGAAAEEEFEEVDLYEEERTPAVEKSAGEEEKEKASQFRPIIAPGIGLMSYYGELSKSEKSSKALVSNMGYDFKVSFPIQESFMVSFHVLRGTLVANERSLERNLNFKSSITSGGFEFSYNFSHLMPTGRVQFPTLMVGFHAMEFLSKTDLKNEAGTNYNYWSDGTIRNIPQGSELDSRSVRISRDYIYETDIRESNLDGLGNYAERTFAIPVGLAINLDLTDQVQFRLGSAMYFTFTDQLDGISSSGTGVRQGDKAKDRFLFSTFSLAYNLSSRADLTQDDEVKDLIAMEKEDRDGDGIADILDDCPNTPEGVEVDSVGCPLDGDADGIANFRDQELTTPDSMFVDTVGIGLTDDALAAIYLRYVDSSGTFSPIEDTLYATQKPTQLLRRKGTFAVQVDDETAGLTPSEADEVLGTRKVESLADGEKSVLAVGDYDNIEDAVAKQQDLKSKGVPTTAIIAKTPAGKLVQAKEVGMFVGAASAKDIQQVEGVIYRIQMGAFSKKPDLNAYKSVGKIIPIKTSDGLTRVYHGLYNNYEEAAQAKQQLIGMGFGSVFIKAFATKGASGLPSGGVKSSAKPGYYKVDAENADKNKVRFKIQVGSFSKTIPNELVAKFINYGNVTSENTDNGGIRYFVGSFGSTQEEAQGLLTKVRSEGLKDAFMVGEYEGKTISVTDAKKIAGE